jgi:hypothetical protein
MSGCSQDGLTCSPSVDAGSLVTFGSALYISLASADLNGDGILDLVAADYPSSNPDAGFDVFLGNSDGGLTGPAHHTGCDGFAIPVIGDLNGDHRPDIVVSYGQGAGANVFLQLADGGFADPVFYPAVNEVSSLGLGDVNGDGFLDLVIAENVMQTNSFLPGGMEVRLNDGAGAFQASSVIAGSGFAVAVADFNRDGLADIAAYSNIAASGDAGITVMLSEGDGGFTADTIPGDPQAQIIAVPVSGSFGLVYAGVQGLRTLVNSGSGSFSAGVTYPLTEPVISDWLAVGDFNDDGIVDLAASGENCSLGIDGGLECTGGINILFGLADGGFQAAMQVANGYHVLDIAALGPVDHPRALAMANLVGGITVYGDASKH